MTTTVSVPLALPALVLEAVLLKAADENLDVSACIEKILVTALRAEFYLTNPTRVVPEPLESFPEARELRMSDQTDDSSTPVIVIVEPFDPDAEHELLRMPDETDDQFARRLRIFEKSLAKMRSSHT